MMRLFRISKRERGHFRWFNDFSKFNIVKKHKFALKRLRDKRKLNINKKSLSRRKIVLPLVKKKLSGKSIILRGNVKKKSTNKFKLVSSLLS